MSIIALNGSSLNSTMGICAFGGLSSAFISTKKSTNGLQDALSILKAKIEVSGTVSNVDISHENAVKAHGRESTKNSSLTIAYEKLDTLISDMGKTDNKVSNKISRREDDFYKKYSYLKPECKKSKKEKAKDWCEARLNEISNFCSGVKNAIKNIIKKGVAWCKECWEEITIALSTLVSVGALCIFTFPYSILILGTLSLAFLLTSSSIITTTPYVYDKSSVDSMAACLGIDKTSFFNSMASQYGFDDNISQMYLRLYLEVHNSRSMNGKSEYELTCEFNRIIASLCLNYDGSAKRWHLTTDNYSSVVAYQMLIDDYGFSKEEAIDFVIAINVQHGAHDINHPELTSCQYTEKSFGFSRFEGSLFTQNNEPTINDFISVADSYGTNPMRDFSHEAIQYVEFNDNYDLVDFASGSTDRMISYSGDIVSGRYDAADFHSDIDANNIQFRLNNSNDNFIAVQQKYNEELMNNQTDAKNEFIKNNGGIKEIRNNILYDIRHTLAAYIDRGDETLLGNPSNREEYHNNAVNDFIEFLEN